MPIVGLAMTIKVPSATRFRGCNQYRRPTVSFAIRTDFVLWSLDEFSQSLRIALCRRFVLSRHRRSRVVGSCPITCT